MGVSSEKSVGRRLREAREARSVELARAAQETRINRRFLEALERDAAPEEFPAPMYARAFLREYARYLGLEAEPLVASYRMNHLEPEEPIRPPMPIERRSAAMGSILAILSVGALLAIAVFAGRGEERPMPRVASPPSTPSPSPPTVAGERTENRARAVRLTIRVVDRPSWIEVIRDERVLVRETLEPGVERTFRDRRRLDLVVGDAGAVRVTLNGKRLGRIGDDGQVFEGSAVLRRGQARLVSSG